MSRHSDIPLLTIPVPEVLKPGLLVLFPGGQVCCFSHSLAAAGLKRRGFLAQMVDYAKESEPFASHVCGLGSA